MNREPVRRWVFRDPEDRRRWYGDLLCVAVAVFVGVWVKHATNSTVVGLGVVLLVCVLGQAVYYRSTRKRR